MTYYKCKYTSNLPYVDFLDRVTGKTKGGGIKKEYQFNKNLFPFQVHIVEKALRKKRFAIFADCGLGKSLIELEWSRQIMEEKNKPCLIVCPLGVTKQMESEGQKFGIPCKITRDGKLSGTSIYITNYEMLKHFNPGDFASVAIDESSILKNVSGKLRKVITYFLRKFEYRLCASATPAPNDYPELGNTSEALGYRGYDDMLSLFFCAENKTMQSRGYQVTPKYRFRAHGEKPFWIWVGDWAISAKKPSDIGPFSDEGYILPPLQINDIIVEAQRNLPGKLPFPDLVMPAKDIREMRAERRETIGQRCEKVAEIAENCETFLAWGYLNDETELLTKMIPGAVEIKGPDSYEEKEEALMAFARGEIRALVTKPKIAGFGMNFQKCSNMSVFPSHSYEQLYQVIRRCWRYGQKNPVNVNIVSSMGEKHVINNIRRKEANAAHMFAKIIENMNEKYKEDTNGYKKMEVPRWLLTK